MIALIRGAVVDRSDGAVVVDVQGVGYRVLVPAGTAIPAPGREVTLHTSLQVREDSLTLYGFMERGSLRLFELLLTSAGVGPKLGLAALSALAPAALETALAEGDVAVLTSVPGIGRKVADRLVLELRDRVAGASIAPAGTVASGDDADVATVREALLGFGFTALEVRGVLAGLGAVDGEDAAGLLRRALSALGRTGEGAS
jgi:holliday junction DNA helicase RuvA